MKKLSFKEVIKPALILFAICLIVAAALAGTNALTADKIKQSAQEAESLARSQVLKGESYELVSDGDVTVYAVLSKVTSLFDSDKSPTDVSETDISAADISATDEPTGELSVIGYVAVTSAKGYGGDVQVMVGIDKDMKITGVQILDNSETAGLGANCTKTEWLEQFIGMSGKLAVKKDGGEVDAITSATITSRAVCKAINNALDAVNTIKGGSEQ